MPYQLLFVCLGNICRSPAAEGVMNYLIQDAGRKDHIRCDSAGTSNYHTGAPPDHRMIAAAHHQGIVLQGRSRQVRHSDFEHFDLILAMDRENHQDLLRLDRTTQYHHKVRLMCDFCREYPDSEVPDPYYSGPEGFSDVLDLLHDACAGLLLYLTEVDLTEVEGGIP